MRVGGARCWRVAIWSNKAHLQSTLERTDGAVATTGGEHAQNIIGHAGGLTSAYASPPAVHGAAAGDSCVQAACASGSRPVYTCAAMPTTVLLLACVCGEGCVVRELLALTGDRAVDVHAGGEGGFHAVCRGGHVDVVRKLLALTGDRAVDVHAKDEAGFREACVCRKACVVRELLALTGDRAVDLHALVFFEISRSISLDPWQARRLRSFTKQLLHPPGQQQDSSSRWQQPPSAAVAQLCTYVHAVYAVIDPDGALAVLSVAAGRLPPGLPLPDMLRVWRAHPDNASATHQAHAQAGVDMRDECLQAALDACGGDSFRRPALAHQVIQQVLMHAVEARHGSGSSDSTTGLHGRGDGDGVPLRMLHVYCVLLAALPGAECAPLRHALQQQQHGCGGKGSQADSTRATAGMQTAAMRQGCLAAQCACRLQDAVWAGVHVPARPVRQQVDEGGLEQALVRHGRRCMVLHRVASVAARRSAKQTDAKRHRAKANT